MASFAEKEAESRQALLTPATFESIALELQETSEEEERRRQEIVQANQSRTLAKITGEPQVGKGGVDEVSSKAKKNTSLEFRYTLFICLLHLKCQKLC
jgi:hypothetical protein